MFNLNKLADELTARDLGQKSFFDMDRDEITAVAEAVLNSFDDEVPAGGWAKPFIDKGGDVVFPMDVHPTYRWWTSDGQSILDTLAELGATYEVARKYFNRGENHKPTEDEWKARISAWKSG